MAFLHCFFDFMRLLLQSVTYFLKNMEKFHKSNSTKFFNVNF